MSGIFFFIIICSCEENSKCKHVIQSIQMQVIQSNVTFWAKFQDKILFLVVYLYIDQICFLNDGLFFSLWYSALSVPCSTQERQVLEYFALPS